MFPVDSVSNLNSDDFSFLDTFCLSEDKRGENENMAELNALVNNSIQETNILSDDWLSGNVNIDAATIAEQNFDRSQELNLFYDYSNASLSSYPVSGHVTGSSIDMVLDPSKKEPLQTEKLSSEEVMLSSSDMLLKDDEKMLSDVSVFSENEELSLDYLLNDDSYSVAGKKYLQMRKKNNVASQRSRKLRKQKNLGMVEKLRELEEENKKLTSLVSKMEKERDALQRQVIQIISKK